MGRGEWVLCLRQNRVVDVWMLDWYWYLYWDIILGGIILSIGILGAGMCILG